MTGRSREHGSVGAEERSGERLWPTAELVVHALAELETQGVPVPPRTGCEGQGVAKEAKKANEVRSETG
jgi:hypothetical protein